jgi:hypothetical protein
MKNESIRKFSVHLSFEEISLPPFEDILILGKKCSHGRIGVSKSFEMLGPNEFETIDIEDDVVETVFVNRRILKKIDKSKVVHILKEKVFPYISDSEIIKVDFKLKIFYDTLEG